MKLGQNGTPLVSSWTSVLAHWMPSRLDCGVCLREMIKYWLSTKSHNATSDALLEALVSDMVGENTLAEKARHLHLTLNPHEGGT